MAFSRLNVARRQRAVQADTDAVCVHRNFLHLFFLVATCFSCFLSFVNQVTPSASLSPDGIYQSDLFLRSCPRRHQDNAALSPTKTSLSTSTCSPRRQIGHPRAISVLCSRAQFSTHITHNALLTLSQAARPTVAVHTPPTNPPPRSLPELCMPFTEVRKRVGIMGVCSRRQTTRLHYHCALLRRNTLASHRNKRRYSSGKLPRVLSKHLTSIELINRKTKHNTAEMTKLFGQKVAAAATLFF